MKLKRPNKSLEATIVKASLRLKCPIHQKTAKVKMPSETEEVEVEACCPFFKNDVFIVGERLRKEFLYKDEKKRERLERERKKSLRNDNE